MEAPRPRRAALLFLVVFGAGFAFLGLLLAALVAGSRLASVRPDQGARDAWVLVGAVAALAAGAGFFGMLFRLALNEGRERERGP